MNNDERLPQPKEGKTDSFYGDRSVVMTKKQLAEIRKNPLLRDFYLSDIGFYPHAKNHFRNRKTGINQHILIYCIDGSGYIKLDDQTHKLSSDTFFVIEEKRVHSYWASPSNPWSIYWVHFGGKRSHYFNNHFNKINTIAPAKDSRVDDRIRLFNEILTILESGFTKEIAEYTNLFLNSLLATFFYVEAFRASKGYQGSDPVDQSIFFMQKNIERQLKIVDIASHVKLSESHLSKLFRNKTGTSPIEYFINLKMQEAIRLLSNKSMKIKEVAFKLGYNDPFYFSRIFTKHIGSSPTSFLKTTRKPK